MASKKKTKAAAVLENLKAGRYSSMAGFNNAVSRLPSGQQGALRATGKRWFAKKEFSKAAKKGTPAQAMDRGVYVRLGKGDMGCTVLNVTDDHLSVTLSRMDTSAPWSGEQTSKLIAAAVAAAESIIG